MLSGRAGVLAAFLVALVIIAAQVALKRADRLQPDERSYLSIINPLIATGVYTDGNLHSTSKPGQAGRFVAPAFPLLVAALAKLDSGLAKTLACLDTEPKVLRTACGSLASFLALQVMLAALGIGAIYIVARVLSDSDIIAWASLLLALATGESATYARLLLTDTLAFTAFLIAITALVCLVVKGEMWQAALAGAAIGVATLARPGYSYLLYAAALAIPAAALLWPRASALRWHHGAVVAAAGLATLAPWMIRNYVQFGDSALTAGYAGFTLVQRVAYNAMTWQEWLAAWIFWLPDIGDDLAKLLFKPEHTARLGFIASDTYYKTGAGPLMTETLNAAGGPDKQLGYLVRNYVLGDLVKHSAVTLVLAWRGLWAGKWLGVIALVLAWPVLRTLVQRDKLAPLLALALPLLFTLGLHAFVSVNIVRYNVPFIALFSFIVAFAAAEAGARWRSSAAGAPVT